MESERQVAAEEAGLYAGNVFRSAWSTYYRYGLKADADTQLGMSIRAVKAELVYNRFDKNIKDTPAFGDAARDRTKDFQKAKDLEVDGVVGPMTARALWVKRCDELETAREIPSHLLRRLKTLESGDDPNAVGSADPNDHGLVQVNAPSHPNVSLHQAVDPAWCLPWAAGVLRDVYDSLQDWDVALVSWNQGFYYARKWLEAGKPASGGPTFTISGRTYDRWQLATQYVTLVKRMPL